jgi:DNA-binding response OmpR family regulator
VTHAEQKPQNTTHSILVVEASESSLPPVHDYLRGRGLGVIRARGQSEAESALRESKVALALVELRFGATGAGDGLGVVRDIRRRDPTLPIVLLASYAPPEQLLEGHRLGADLVIDRPCRLAEIAEIVDRLLFRAPSGD